jgi:hypothetical protein
MGDLSSVKSDCWVGRRDPWQDLVLPLVDTARVWSLEVWG